MTVEQISPVEDARDDRFKEKYGSTPNEPTNEEALDNYERGLGHELWRTDHQAETLKSIGEVLEAYQQTVEGLRNRQHELQFYAERLIQSDDFRHEVDALYSKARELNEELAKVTESVRERVRGNDTDTANAYRELPKDEAA